MGLLRDEKDIIVFIMLVMSLKNVYMDNWQVEIPSRLGSRQLPLPVKEDKRH